MVRVMTSRKAFLICLACALVSLALGAGLVLLFYPNVFKGDARWAEIAAYFIPAIGFAVLTLAILFLVAANALRPLLAAIGSALARLLALRSLWFSRGVWAILMLAYAVLVWIYFFNGWQVL